ncbi:MAG: DUF4358 domain-containing protein [Clostridiales bacterium]|jgi:hypothetical protein|nr:DUF4358 domain-containing protein [Clostridiales bacterium]
MKCKNKSVFYVLITLFAVGIMGIAAGCEQQKTEYQIDPSKLVSEVLETVHFASEMQELDKDSLAITYTIEENTEVIAYMAGGALSDEIIVFTAPDESTAKKMLDHVKAHIEERSELFADYAPAEVVKLEKAYTLQKGKYVVVCVTDDISNAKTIINKHF